MANLVRNDLTIEGPNVHGVLDAIGFKQPSTLQGLNEVVLIDLYRLGHEFTCEWPMPYGGYLDGDVFEVTDNKASFKFYTKNTHAQKVIWAISNRFPEYKFTYSVNWAGDDLIGGEVVERGEQTSFVNIHFHASFCPDYEEPPNPECNVPGCSVLFLPFTESQLKEFRRRRTQQAKKDAEEFQAEEAK